MLLVEIIVIICIQSNATHIEYMKVMIYEQYVGKCITINQFLKLFGVPHCSVSPHYGKIGGEENVGLMFLTEVALGREHITMTGGNFKKAPAGFDSIVARGHTEPSE